MFCVIRNVFFLFSALLFSLLAIFSSSPYIWWTKMTTPQQIQLTCLATSQKKSASFTAVLDWITCSSLKQSLWLGDRMPWLARSGLTCPILARDLNFNLRAGVVP